MKKHIWIIFTIIVVSLSLSVPSWGARPYDVYQDYSSEKSTIFFNTTGNYNNAVFFDFFHPFDPALNLNTGENHDDVLIQYKLDNSTYNKGTSLMVALDDLEKLYDPYFEYSVDANVLNVKHAVFEVETVSGAGSRSPVLRYTKITYVGEFALSNGAFTVTRTTYESTTSSGQIATRPPVGIPFVTIGALDYPPETTGGKLFVPVASLMQAMGKIIMSEPPYLGIRTSLPQILSATSTRILKGWQRFGNVQLTWKDYMNGVLDGSIAKGGHFWKGFYIGDNVELFDTNNTTAMPIDNEPKVTQDINRILPYNIYVPHSYNPSVPNKLCFFIHGGTGNENAPFERMNNRKLGFEEAAEKYGYIILSPNGWTRNPAWVRGAARYSFFKAFDMACEDYNVDLNKVFLSGNSMGGSGAWNLMVRYPDMFRAVSIQAPANAGRTFDASGIPTYKSRVGDKPTFFVNGTADVTVPYTYTATWVHDWVKDVFDTAYYVAVEEGEHTHSVGALQDAIHSFFDRVLENEVNPPLNFQTLTIPEEGSRVLLDKKGFSLANPTTTNADGVTMIALSDLEAIYAPDFNSYRVAAYNEDPALAEPVVTILHNNTSLNIKLDDTFLRVNMELHSKDILPSITGATLTWAQGAVVPERNLSAKPYEVNGEIYVPAVEIMDLLGRTVTTVFEIDDDDKCHTLREWLEENGCNSVFPLFVIFTLIPLIAVRKK